MGPLFEVNGIYRGDHCGEQPGPIEDGKCPGVILDNAEALWLQTCRLATTGRFLRGK